MPTIHTEAVASKIPSYDILSLNELHKNGITIDFNKSQVRNKEGITIAKLEKIGPYYWLPMKYILTPKTYKHVLNIRTNQIFPLDFVHRLLGHINVRDLRRSIKQGILTNLSLTDIDWKDYSNFQCEICASGKSNKHKHMKGSRVKYQKSYKPFEYLHTDIFGPVPRMPKASPSYMLAFTDEATRFKWVYPLWNKDAKTITDVFRALVNMISTQFGGKVLSFQMDKGSEYTNSTIRQFFRERGILPCYTSSGDSRANGIAERLNLLLLNDCRTLLQSSGLPQHLWFFAVQFSTLMRNSIITSSIGTSSRAKAGLAGLDVSTILPFGQRVIVNRRTTNKLTPRGIQGFALTPSTESHGYLIYIPSKHIVTDTTNYMVIRGGPNMTNDADNVIDPLLEQLAARQKDINDIHMPTISGGTELGTSQTTDTNNIELSDPWGGKSNPTTDVPDITYDEEADIEEHNLESMTSDHEAEVTEPTSIDEEIPDSISKKDEIPPRHRENNTGNTLENSQINIDSTSYHEVNPMSAIASTIGISDETDNSSALMEYPEPVAHPERREPPIKPTTLRPNGVDDARVVTTTDVAPQTKSIESISNLGGSEIDQPLNDDEMHYRKDKIFRYRNGEISSITRPRTKRLNNDVISEIEDRTQNKKTKRQILYINAVRFEPSPQIKPSLSYNEAISKNKNSEDAEGYKKAYMKEYDQLINMKTWNPDKPIDEALISKQRIINSMFIFTTKRDGTRKCRFVARGDQQRAGTYQENLKADTVHHYALMTSLNIALDNKMYVTQLDISSAYLYADLEEELYVRAPPHMNAKGKVFRLNKSLYGLKQSGANWYKKIGDYLKNTCHMKELIGWPCVFKDNNGTFLCLFVDDMVVVSKDLRLANKLIEVLREEFETKVVHDGQLDEAKAARYDILGLEIEYIHGKKMTIGMEKSLSEKIPHLDFAIEKNSRMYRVPGTPGEKIHKDNLVVEEDDYKINVKRMQKTIDLLSYVAYKYRFDILYYVNILAQHTLYPSEQVLKLTKQLVNFVWHTRNKSLIWYVNKHKKNNRLTVITDASFGNEEGFRSQLGHYYCLNGKVLGGRSTSEKLRVISSTEAEIYAVSESIPMLHGTSYLVRQLDDRLINLKVLTDSKPLISIIEDESEDSKTFRNRFFGTRAFRLRDEAREHGIRFEYIKTEDNYADILTKPTTSTIFKKLSSSWMK